MKRSHAMSPHAGCLAAALLALAAAPLSAAPVQIETVVTPREQMRLEFADGSKRYFVMLKREGMASGTGPLAGASVIDWGAHDARPGTGAEGVGYLVFTTPDGDIAYIKSRFHAVALPGADGKPRNILNGDWEVAGATGRLKGLRGAGGLRINVISPTDRQWLLEGEMVQATESPK